MHSSSFDIESGNRDGGDVLVAIAALVTEGRIPGKSSSKNRGFYEGPHCAIRKSPESHNCTPTDDLCQKYERVRREVLHLWEKGIPICVEVLLSTLCTCNEEKSSDENNALLLEQWYISATNNRLSESTTPFNINQLISAVRSQLYFSQISAWLSSQDQASPKISNANLKYRLTIPGETFKQSKFTKAATKHDFPSTDLGNGMNLKVSLLSLPRMSDLPNLYCKNCEPKPKELAEELFRDEHRWMFDDRMQTSCTMKGKHRCDDIDDFEVKKECKFIKSKRVCCSEKVSSCSEAATSTSKLHLDTQKAECYRLEQGNNVSEKRNSSPNLEQSVKTPKLDLKFNREHLMGALKAESEDPSKKPNKGDVLLNAILRSCRLQNDVNYTNEKSTKGDSVKCDVKCVQRLGEIGSSILNGCAKALQSVSDTNNSDKNVKSDIFNIKNKINIYVDSDCDSGPTVPKANKNPMKIRDISNVDGIAKCKARQKISFDEFKVPSNSTNESAEEQADKGSNIIEIPSPIEQAKFRKSLDNAASMVFHSRTGLPLTSSPAPVRRGKSCFDYDSSINSVQAIKSALFSASFSTDDDSESDGSIVSPCSPETYIYPKKQPSPVKHYRRGSSANLLGSFEESVLNGRLEPVSTVQGFKAELGASGTFVPRHLVVPVTVFFYTLGDNDKVSSPYLGHINLGKKGYNVPKIGTVQVTLFNPLGTVVKMFVIMYDLADMPPNSQTFIRQRTLYMPTNCTDKNLEWGPKWLRYLIHLRFMSSKSGRIYLHSDIRMIIFRKSDLDTATAHGIDMCYELRSFTHMPANPKYSPRK